MDSNMYDGEIEQAIEEIERKKLEICNPIVRTYHFIAFPMSIVCLKEYTKGWFYSNFINIYSYYNAGIMQLDVKYDVQYFEDEVYYLNSEKMNISTIDLVEGSIVSMLVKLINEEKYICIYLDEFYIENSRKYKFEHFEHEFLIYGYDLVNKTFDCMFYGMDKHYKSRQVLFDSLNKGFYSEYLNRDLPVILYKFHIDNIWLRPLYNIDFKYVSLLIRNYVEGHNFLYNRRNINPLNSNIINEYGINVYNDLVHYIEDVKKNKTWVDIIPFYLFYEHKKCMGKRIAYLCEVGLDCKEIFDKYQNIISEAQHIINLLLKVRIRIRNSNINQEKNLFTICEELLDMQENEKQVLLELIDKLDNAH